MQEHWPLVIVRVPPFPHEKIEQEKCGELVGIPEWALFVGLVIFEIVVLKDKLVDTVLKLFDDIVKGGYVVAVLFVSIICKLLVELITGVKV